MLLREELHKLEFKKKVNALDSGIKVEVDDFNTFDRYYIGNSCNIVKLIPNQEYIFIRKDGIETHINPYESSHDTLQKVYENIVEKLDYTLQYADDRKELVEKLLSENEWIYDLMSTKKMILKERKTKKSNLSENQRFDKLIEKISDYICFAKFKNEEDQKDYEKLQKEVKEKEIQLKKKKDKPEIIDELDFLIDKISVYPFKSIKKIRITNKIDTKTPLEVHEDYGHLLSTEEQKLRQKRVLQSHKNNQQLNSEYWNKMYSTTRQNIIPFYDQDLLNEELNKSKLAKDIRKEIIDQYINDINKLSKQLGLHLKNEDRSVHIKQLIQDLHTEELSGERQYAILRNMYSELKGDFNVAKKKLTDEIYFTSMEKPTTEYSIDSDTYYEDNGEIIEISKNRVLLSNANTYKGLILNYNELKDKYYDKFNHPIWSLLFVFDELMNKTKFNNDEQFVLDMLFDNYTQKQIRDKYENINQKQLTNRRISNLINNIIPNKLLSTYLDNVEDWVYTEKIKGEYKKCSCCGEVKLISNDRHFHKEPLGKDGFKNVCKSC